MTVVCHAARAVARIPRWIGMGLIRAYQGTISPLLGPVCKYYPSCSHYGYTAVERYGLVRGSVLAGWRILRCNPWSHGGIDDVPVRGAPLFRGARATGIDGPGGAGTTTIERGRGIT